MLQGFFLEQVTGIEPACSAWEAVRTSYLSMHSGVLTDILTDTILLQCPIGVQLIHGLTFMNSVQMGVYF